jgi:hypothetical protein
MPIIPPDPRAGKDFDVVRLWKNLDRQDYTIVDPSASPAGTPPTEVLVGEPVRQLSDDGTSYSANSTYAYKIDDADDHVVGMMDGSTNDQAEFVLGVSFTHYTNTIAGGGFPDALENQHVTVLKGQFQAKIKRATWFDESVVTCSPGLDVVVLDKATGGAKYRCLGTTYDTGAAPVAGTRYDVLGASGVTLALQQQLDNNCVVGKVDKTDATYAYVTFNIK